MTTSAVLPVRPRRRLYPFQGLRPATTNHPFQDLTALRVSDRRPRAPSFSRPPTGDRLHPLTSPPGPPSPVAAVAESPAAGTIADFLSSLISRKIQFFSREFGKSIIAMSSCDGVYPNRRKAVLVAAALISTILLSAAVFSGLPYHEFGFHHVKKLILTSMEETVSSPHRKLLLPSNRVEEPTRIGGDIKVCSESDLVVNQGPSDPLPSGIPTYTVEIINACATGCDITRIHFSCGWFSSARLIDPSLFKRVGYDDCIVNEGKSLPNGQIISFQYANTFSYPLSVSTMKCL